MILAIACPVKRDCESVLMNHWTDSRLNLVENSEDLPLCDAIFHRQREIPFV